MNYDFARVIVKDVLGNPFRWEWSVQGFGMLRTYFGEDKRFRLNVWDSHLAVPLCSLIHDHPWSFDSLIVSGLFQNLRYSCMPSNMHEATHEWRVIRTGPGGGPDGDGGFCTLQSMAVELYAPGQVYHQEPTEVHASHYEDGCVTLNDRKRLPDGEHARVFWPIGSAWVDAMPRPATIEEIDTTCLNALRRFK
jgi:hypothetical protein